MKSIACALVRVGDTDNTGFTIWSCPGSQALGSGCVCGCHSALHPGGVGSPPCLSWLLPPAPVLHALGQSQ